MIHDKIQIYADGLTEYRSSKMSLEVEDVDAPVYRHMSERYFNIHVADKHKEIEKPEKAVKAAIDLLRERVGVPDKSFSYDKRYIAIWRDAFDLPAIFVNLHMYMKDEPMVVSVLSPSACPVHDKLLGIFIDSGLFTRSKESPDKVMVKYAFPRPGGLDVRVRDFVLEPFDEIRRNYTPSVQDAFADLLERAAGAANGLVIINGPPGTGKTHLIRSLLTELKGKRTGMICVPPLDFLTNLSKMVDAMGTDKSSLVVFEDLGDVLTSSASRDHAEVFSNLLNVSDGLLSLLNDALMLLSFNTDIEKIEPALLREGRCIGQIEVGELPREQAQEILLADGHNFVLSKASYSLAEVYEMKRRGSVLPHVAKRSSVGFGI